MPEAQDRDQVMQMLGRIDGRTEALASQLTELRLNSVTKEVLEAKIGPLRMFIFGLIGLVLTLVAIAVFSGALRIAQPQNPIYMPVVSQMPVRTP